MTMEIQQFRLFELECLSELSIILDYSKEWLPLYRNWLKYETNSNVDIAILELWVTKIVKINDNPSKLIHEKLVGRPSKLRHLVSFYSHPYY